MIRLDGGYAIEVDSMGYTLGIPRKTKVTNKKTGEETEKEVLTEPKYFGTIDQTLLCYWKLMRRKSLYDFEGSIKEALEVVKKLDEKILKRIDEYKAVIK